MRRLMSTLLLVFGSIAATNSAFSQETPVTEKEVPYERRPYEVRVLVAFDSSTFDANIRRSIIEDFRLVADRCVGRLWDLKADEIAWLSPSNSLGLERLDQTVISSRYANETADVWYVATVENQPVGTRVSVRSWQPEVAIGTSIVSQDILDRREIPVSIIRSCRDLFRPMGIVEQVNDRSVRTRLRGGEIATPDPSFKQLSAGDLLQPLLAYRDKNRKIDKLQTIPWTYVAVNEIDGSTIMGTVQSGLRMSLGGKKRGRIDTLMVAMKPQSLSTTIELVTQSRLPVALGAHRLEMRSEPIIPRPTEANPDVDPKSTLLGEVLTDRRGMATVSVVSDHRMVWLFVFSGDNQLARVPLIPGLQPHVRLEVPDDSTRLAAEADLQMLQGEVIDAVALRNTAFATIRSAAKRDDWPLVNQKLALLKKAQSGAIFLDRLNAVRVAGTTSARNRKDRVAEARINRICDDTATLIKAHMNEDKVRLLVEEMDALQSASAAVSQDDPKKEGQSPSKSPEK